MPDRRTDWSAVFAVLVSAATIGVILWIAVSFFGCAAVRANAAGVNTGQQVTADRVELMESALVDLDRKLEIQAGNQQSGQAGRDVTINDPWPARIAVAALGAIPVAFLVYLLAHRIKAVRNVLDAIKGKPCPERQAGRCVPVAGPGSGDALEALAERYSPSVGVFPVKHGPQDDQG